MQDINEPNYWQAIEFVYGAPFKIRSTFILWWNWGNESHTHENFTLPNYVLTFIIN